MAEYKIPYQNLTYDLPDEGEIFRTPSISDPRQGQIFKRQGGKIIRLGEQQFRAPNNASVRLGDVLPQYGINFGGIREVSPEAVDILQSKLGHALAQGTLQDFQSSTPQRTGEAFTQGFGQTNPNAATITSSLRCQLQKESSPPSGIGASGQFGAGGFPINKISTGFNALPPGVAGPVMPQQAQALSRQGQIGQAQASLADIQRTLLLAQQQRASDVQAGQAQTFQPGTATSLLPQTGGGGGSFGGAGGDLGGITQPSLSDQYFKQLLESLKPSTEETETQKKLQDIIAQQQQVQADLGLRTANLSTLPVATSIISGHQAEQTRLASAQLGGLSAQAVPLQQRLAQEQAKRQSSMDVTKLGLEYQQGKEKTAAELAKEQRGYANQLALAKANRSPSDIYGAGAIGEYHFAKSQGYKGTFSDYQNEDANRRAKALVAGLTPGQTQTTINQITSQFDNEAVVKNYNVIAEGYQFANSIKNRTTPSSADDIGLIYAFAKAMDPNSVVREGEYATVQKYAQSWAQAFGFKVERIFSNVPFLSPSAKENMVGTIKTRYDTSRQNYNNVAKEYQRRIEDAKSGRITGSITDYGGAYQEEKPQQMNLNGKILNLQPDGTYQ